MSDEMAEFVVLFLRKEIKDSLARQGMRSTKAKCKGPLQEGERKEKDRKASF